MAMRNTDHNFGWVAKTFHWLMALMILSAIALGVIARRLGVETSQAIETKVFLFSIHKTLGVTIFFVALFRIIWALCQPKPKPIAGQKASERFLASLAHWCLYLSLVFVPLTGWINHAATTGFAPIWWPFGQDLPLVPKSSLVEVVFSYLHIYIEKILLIALIAHVVGAIKHHVIDKDATLRRMISNPQVTVEASQKSWLPLGLAMVIFCAVGAYAVSAGQKYHFEGNYDHAPSPDLDLALLPSEWDVREGTLSVTITQLGGPVQGHFEDWTAAIIFDPSVTNGVAGNVDVQIAIASLTLGTVSPEAMGRDFFNTAEFETANFTANIIADNGSYSADGVLRIKGVERPQTFDFELKIAGGAAEMNGSTTLQRLDFGIGDHLGDAATLGFAVQVGIELIAEKSGAD